LARNSAGAEFKAEIRCSLVLGSTVCTAYSDDQTCYLNYSLAASV